MVDDSVNGFMIPQKNMTYAVNEEYSLRVKDEMNDSCEFEVSILEDYLTPDQMAELFVKSDCMIHAQITDALSASVQEILYAGKLVFNPEWLASVIDSVPYELKVNNDIFDIRKYEKSFSAFFRRCGVGINENCTN